jgi:uncharacterized protein
MFWLAFITGIVGSLHCVGMCGPIMLILPTSPDNFTDFFNKFIYQIGRISAYALLGVFIGIIGGELVLAGLQQYLSIITGIILLMLALGYVIPNNFQLPLISKWKSWVSTTFSSKLSSNKTINFPILGFLNGLLPCGLVYVALVTALNVDSYYHGAFYMAFFGLGTLPVMLGLAIFKGYFQTRLKGSFSKIYPVFTFFIACLLVLRGLNLGIPYISPEISNAHNRPALECCSKR